MDVPEIDIHDAKEALDRQEATFVDIRDPLSHAQARIPGCRHVTGIEDMDRLDAETAKDAPLIVYCYHGNSSLGATGYLTEQGFTHVRSLRGGFEAWRLSYDVEESGS